MKAIEILIVTMMAFIAGCMAGSIDNQRPYAAMLHECQKHHNAFECELVAVPKEGK